ncbi:hypothetical protein Ocin01_11642 [Orchesella cincta]|uniref:Uncharacterized protein n=1 Tax=Orchesella cincta TaxID=48709 RepID=A0A1D2MQF1_ORCCI|nr:hypothetical protein Ocin01_11642 [Orchesella cincta]
MSKYQRAAAEANSYPVTTSTGSSGTGGVITSGSKSLSSGGSGSSHHHHHHHHSSSSSAHSEKGESSHESSTPVVSKKQSKSSESKSSRSQNSKSSSQSIVPGSAFNFSSLTPELALYSKEMSDPSSLYSASPPTLTPPLAHRADFYPTSSASFHSSFSAAARTTAGGVPTPPITPYQIPPFIGSHPSPYQPQPVSSQPFAAHSQSSRGLAVDPYQQLFQNSPHVMGLLPHTGYPAPYAHPHSSLGFNRPGWI